MKLYHHKTDGGAEYLMDTFIQCDYCNKCQAKTPKDRKKNCSVCGTEKHKEGIFKGAKYIVRIDGDIEKDAELNVSEPEGWSECNHYATSGKGLCVRCGFNTLRLTNKQLKARKKGETK
jgi:hypothetical protein